MLLLCCLATSLGGAIAGASRCSSTQLRTRCRQLRRGPRPSTQLTSNATMLPCSSLQFRTGNVADRPSSWYSCGLAMGQTRASGAGRPSGDLRERRRAKLFTCARRRQQVRSKSAYWPGMPRGLALPPRQQPSAAIQPVNVAYLSLIFSWRPTRQVLRSTATLHHQC
jgi:hypothetical protein